MRNENSNGNNNNGNNGNHGPAWQNAVTVNHIHIHEHVEVEPEIGNSPAQLYHSILDNQLTIGGSLAEQHEVFDVSIYALHDGNKYSLSNDGVWLDTDFLTTFDNLPIHTAFRGELFGEDGVFSAIDTAGADKGLYKFGVEIFDHDSIELIQPPTIMEIVI